MKILKTLLVLSLLLVPAILFAGNSVTVSGDTIQIKNIDSDFTYSGQSILYGPSGEGARINFIKMTDTDEQTYIKVKNGSDSGAVVFYSVSSYGQAPVYFHGARLKPVLDFSACSVAHDSTELTIQLWPFR